MWWDEHKEMSPLRVRAAAAATGRVGKDKETSCTKMRRRTQHTIQMFGEKLPGISAG